MQDLQKFLKLFLKRLLFPLNYFQAYLPDIDTKYLSLNNIVSFILGVVLLVIFASFIFTSKNSSILAVSRQPLFPVNHFKMAEEFLSNGQLNKAKKELQLVNNSFVMRNLLKISLLNYKYQHTQDKVYESDRIKEQLSQLDSILEKKPFYRDLLLKKSIFLWKQWKNKEAKNSLEKAAYLDPNNLKIKSLKKKLSL